MFRATPAPVLRTAPAQAARGGVGTGLVALVQSVWGRSNLALVALVAGIFLAIFALGAGGAAYELSVSQLPSGSSQIAPAGDDSAETIASVGENLTRVGRGTLPDFDAEFKAAEFEQEEEDGHSKALAVGASLTTVLKFSRATDERFGRATCAFAIRIGDFRELPRGPPSFC